MMMKRKSRSSREAMERTEFSREATRLDREFQYLQDRPVEVGEHMYCMLPVNCTKYIPYVIRLYFYLVILKIRSKRTQRNTEMPRGDMILVSTRMVSRIPPQTTKLSKRLKSDTKYACGEKTQILLSTESSDGVELIKMIIRVRITPTCRPRLYIFNSISLVKSASNTLLAISEKSIKVNATKHKRYKMAM